MDPDRARELLRGERERIERELAELVHPDEDEAEEASEFDPENLAKELFEDELAEGRRVELRERLAAIERAERRLAAGTYGLSIQSGEPIPDERLEAIPTTELTVAEAEERARLGHSRWSRALLTEHRVAGSYRARPSEALGHRAPTLGPRARDSRTRSHPPRRTLCCLGDESRVGHSPLGAGGGR